eukprot:TRINITY_DN4830_c0_g1_i1.p1 TRINITY_DN4830_c0_g1~~TRINITY_DN4830_c0_g1_i1.p1  ORF type:complete len:550 (+),score=127.29 TRINITY_DN4830_c0_g1_i1:139-1788(+)
MPTRRENGQARSVGIGEGSDKHNEIMTQIQNDEKLKNLIQDGKPAPAPFNGVIYNQEAQLDAVGGGNLSPTSSMTASLKGGDSSVVPERSTSDQSSVMESGFHAVGRTGSVALNELDECKPDEEEVPNNQNAKDKSLTVDGTGMASAVVLQAINEESDNLSRSKSQGRSAKEGKKNWLSGFFGSFRRGRGKEQVIKQEGASSDLESHEIVGHQEGGEDEPPFKGDDDVMTARSAPEMGPPAETSEMHEDEVPIQEQVQEEFTDQGEATVMENQEDDEEVEQNKGLQLEQTITIEPVETDEHEQEQQIEKVEPEKVEPDSKIPAPPPLPAKPIDRSDPGDVSSIASKFNIPEKPLIPKVKKTTSYLKDDDVGITLGMRRAASGNKKKQTDEQPTTSTPKQTSLGSAHSQDKLDDENEAVSSQTSEENRVQKLMKGWHQGAPIKAQALGEEDQEPEVEELSLEKSTSSTIKSPPPKNQNISSIRESFKEQEQRFMEKRVSKLGSVEKAGVKGAVLKFDVPPPKPPKKEPNKESSFGQNLLKFQEESKTGTK